MPDRNDYDERIEILEKWAKKLKIPKEGEDFSDRIHKMEKWIKEFKHPKEKESEKIKHPDYSEHFDHLKKCVKWIKDFEHPKKEKLPDLVAVEDFNALRKKVLGMVIPEIPKPIIYDDEWIYSRFKKLEIALGGIPTHTPG